MEVEFFDDGVERFIYSLEKATIAKLLRTVDLLERFGYRLGMPHSKKITAKLFELRIRGSQEVRLLYVFHAGKAVVIHGFVKKTSAIPVKELNTARRRVKLLLCSE